MLDRDQLLSRARAVRAELDRKSDRLTQLEAFLAVPDWGSCSGSSFHVGDRVRLGIIVYECVQDHTFALIRSPLNLLYWRISTDIDIGGQT